MKKPHKKTISLDYLRGDKEVRDPEIKRDVNIEERLK